MPPPDGTRAWRKGWRKRWREGSSFRSLSPVAKVIVHWVEENCDDEGQVVTTMAHLASMAGGKDHRAKVNRMRAWRAVREAVGVGILRTEALQLALQGEVQPPTKITRLNFKDYQATEPDSVTGSVTGLGTEALRSSRGKQKNAETKKHTEADASAPGWHELIAGLNGCWTANYQGQKCVWHGRDFRALKALRASLSDDEILRRFGNYLANRDPFFAGHPVGIFCTQINRFVAGAVPNIRIGSAPAESHESFKARGGGVQSW